MTWRKSVKACAGVFSSALFLWWVFKDVHWDTVWEALDKLAWWGPCVAFIATCVSQNIRTWRFSLLVRAYATLPWRLLWHVGNVGHMAVFALPFRLGEFTRPYMMRKQGVPLATSLGVVFIERVMDGLFMMASFFICLGLLPASSHVPVLLKQSAYLALGVFVCAACVGVWFARHPSVAIPLCESVHRRTGWPVHVHARFFSEGLRTLPNAKSLWEAVVLTVVAWCFSGVSGYVLMRAFGWPVPVSCGFLINAVLALGTLVPAGPGFVGVYQAALLVALGLYGYNTHDAAAYGVVVYPLGIVVLCVCLFFSWLFLKSRKIF
jgi:uncharacterized protein (TIRG00374 family)